MGQLVLFCFAELPDTSIADTSTEELNTSQGSQGDSEQDDSKGENKEKEPEKSEEAPADAAVTTEAEPASKEAMEVRNRYCSSRNDIRFVLCLCQTDGDGKQKVSVVDSSVSDVSVKIC